MQLNKNIKLIINYLLGPAVFFLLAYAIYSQLLKQPNWKESLAEIKEALLGPQKGKVWLVIALMVVNWGIESRKWQLVIRHIQPISLFRAFCATLTGTTLASFTPNRMGEYLGRILYIEEGKKLRSIPLTILCSMAQLLVTILVGCAGILYLQYGIRNGLYPAPPALSFWLNGLLFGMGLLLATLLIFYFRIAWLASILEKIPMAEKMVLVLKILEEFNARILLRILFLSFLRYLVFIVQYALLFAVFGVSLSWQQAAAGMSVVFLVMAVIPTFTFLTELGLRWEASIQIIQLFSGNMVGIFACSFGIWLINLVIPALIGSLFILNTKLFRNK